MSVNIVTVAIVFLILHVLLNISLL